MSSFISKSIAASIGLMMACGAQAAIITSFPADNVAPLATPSTPGTGIIVGPIGEVIDTAMRDKSGYVDADVIVFADAGTDNRVLLTWGSPKTLASLGAYIASDVPSGIDTFLDRETSSVIFKLDMGSGLTLVGTVTASSFIIAPNDTTSIWSLASISGTWSNVTAAEYTFSKATANGTRVGEVTAIELIPEPASLLLTLIGACVIASRRPQK